WSDALKESRISSGVMTGLLLHASTKLRARNSWRPSPGLPAFTNHSSDDLKSQLPNSVRVALRASNTCFGIVCSVIFCSLRLFARCGIRRPRNAAALASWLERGQVEYFREVRRPAIWRGLLVWRGIRCFGLGLLVSLSWAKTRHIRLALVSLSWPKSRQ